MIGSLTFCERGSRCARDVSPTPTFNSRSYIAHVVHVVHVVPVVHRKQHNWWTYTGYARLKVLSLHHVCLPRVHRFHRHQAHVCEQCLNEVW